MADIRFRGLKTFQNYLRRTSNFRRARVGTHRRLAVAWRDGAEAFIRAAMRSILVQTGMSAASFLELSRNIQRQGAEAAINSVLATAGPKRQGIPELPDGVRRRGFQSRQVGESKGRQAYIFRVGDPNRYLFRFNFQTVVFQHSFWEDRQQTINAGFAAFLAVVSSSIDPIIFASVQEWLTGGQRISLPPTNRTFFRRPT